MKLSFVRDLFVCALLCAPGFAQAAEVTSDDAVIQKICTDLAAGQNRLPSEGASNTSNLPSGTHR